jgi:hypothetical protein
LYTEFLSDKSISYYLKEWGISLVLAFGAVVLPFLAKNVAKASADSLQKRN